MTSSKHGTCVRTRSRPAALAVALLAAWAGCSDGVHAPSAAKRDRLSPDAYPQVVVHDALDDDVVVSKVVREPGPPLGVTVALRHLEDRTRQIRYRFIFLTAAGAPENREPDWHMKFLPARTEAFIQGNALDRDAVDWRLEIEPAR